MRSHPRKRLKARLVASGLKQLQNAAAEQPLTMNFDPGESRLVCVSDLHRGRRDGADDFRRSERVYNAALAWYERSGYHLAVLGDAEELWERSPAQVLECTDPASVDGYARSLALERRFADDRRYLRVYGNHDRDWRSRRRVEKYLSPHLGTGATVRAAVAIDVVGEAGPGRILLVHGDAGTLESALLAPISKHFVHFWGYWQKRIGALTGVPAEDWGLRDAQDRAMYEWASDERLLLVTGHTHRPVFASRWTPAVVDTDVIRAAQAELDAGHATLAPERLAEGEFAIAELRRQAGQRACLRQTRPCYFNSGACCFGDGDITAIEIGDGEIRLVRWAWHADDHELVAQVNEREPLGDVLARIRSNMESEPSESQPPEVGDVTVRHDAVPVAVR